MNSDGSSIYPPYPFETRQRFFSEWAGTSKLFSARIAYTTKRGHLAPDPERPIPTRESDAQNTTVPIEMLTTTSTAASISTQKRDAPKPATESGSEGLRVPRECYDNSHYSQHIRETSDFSTSSIIDAQSREQTSHPTTAQGDSHTSWSTSKRPTTRDQTSATHATSHKIGPTVAVYRPPNPQTTRKSRQR